jgi:hypothetical protein
MLFISALLFVYWASRLPSLLRGSEAELNQEADRDLETAFQLWLAIRSFFFPRPFLLP